MLEIRNSDGEWIKCTTEGYFDPVIHTFSEFCPKIDGVIFTENSSAYIKAWKREMFLEQIIGENE